MAQDATGADILVWETNAKRYIGILLVCSLLISVTENDKIGQGNRNTGEGRYECAIWMMAVRNGITEKV